jgi:hypothetical protein
VRATSPAHDVAGTQSKSQLDGFGGSGCKPLRMSQRNVACAPVNSAHSMFLEGIRKLTIPAPAVPVATSRAQTPTTSARTGGS